MDLYCDNAKDYNIDTWEPDGIHDWQEFPDKFVGRNRTEALREAKIAGWTFHKDKTTICPKCNKG
jgi:hypothetical protein